MRYLMQAVVLSTVTMLGCGGGSDNGNPTGPPAAGATNGTLTAQINGTTWNATGTITVNRQQNFIGLAASGFAGSTAYAMVIGIGNATGPGSHNLNVYAGGDGSSITVGGATTGWGTAFQGGSGTITLTSLTNNRVVGTFSGTLIPSPAGAGNMTVANGSFDVTF